MREASRTIPKRFAGYFIRANDNATVVLQLSKQALDLPPAQRKKKEPLVRALLPTSESELQLRAYS
jgi:hypothetical protein